MTRKQRVVFQPSGCRGEVDEGRTILEAARALGVEIEALCGGKGICGKCTVRVAAGSVEREAPASPPAQLSPPSEGERRHLRPADGPGARLACRAEIRGDLEVFVPERSRAGKQVVRKAARELAIALDPAVRKYNLELSPPTLGDLTVGDGERVLRALADGYGLGGLTFDYTALRTLQQVVRAGQWNATATVWMDREVIKVEPGFVGPGYGLAVDIGTTTCVGYLADLETGKIVSTESIMNPQVPYGEDVMSRISYAAGDPGGLETMRAAIVAGINEICERAASAVGAGGPQPAHVIDDLTIVCNTAMHHIFLGIDPASIGRAPFVPAIQRALDIKARDLGITVGPGAYVHVLPLEAGFVGADNVGVLIAEEPYNQDELVLIVDIGTNGELLLGNRQRVCSASCATGPAFEGAQITFGMRAAPGAIETVAIDPATREPRYTVIGWGDRHADDAAGRPRGLCGSGVIAVVAEMFKAGIIDPSGRFVIDQGTPRVRRGAGGQPEYVLAWADETAVNTDITVTQADVRALQLAKGALYAGARLLMKRLGVEKIDRVVLAGAFGSRISKEAALVLGLFPDCGIERVCTVGNAAGDGARLALLNRGKRAEAGERARWVEFVEIATDPLFEREFMAAMHIPHMKDRFPSVKALLDRDGSAVRVRG